MIKIVGQSTYYQFLMFLRIKQAVFFSLVFPVFLFFIFGNLWGTADKNYISLLLSGIIGMTVASDGLFAVGPVVREYYASGLIKYLRKLPFNILWHFIGLILSRIISLLFIIVLLCLTAKLAFDYSITLSQLLDFISGIFIGLFLFSFMGLVITFSGIKHNSSAGLINLIYFIMLFTSKALYHIENDTINLVGNILPLNSVLSILRGEGFHASIIAWLLFTIALFYYLFNKVKFGR